MPDLYEFELHVSRCDKPMTFVAASIGEAIGMMELSFPKYENRKCLDWSAGRLRLDLHGETSGEGGQKLAIAKAKGE